MSEPAMTASAMTEPEVLLRGIKMNRTYQLPRTQLRGPAPLRHAVVDVDIEVRRGETVALIGESGSGKSTLVRGLLALDRDATGQVEFAGRPVNARARTKDLHWLRAATGVVLQDPYASLDPWHTVGRIIAEPLEALDIAGDHQELVGEMLERVGLPRWRAGQYPHQLSGGLRQRVAIARALVHRPQLLVGDEPLSALDVTVRAQVLELLGELRAEMGLTMLLVSHDIALVQNLADYVYVLKGGVVVECGKVSEVLRNPAHPYTKKLLAAVPTFG